MSEETIHDRAFLSEPVDRRGLHPLPTEWWHYDYRGYERFELPNSPLDSVP